MNSLATNKSSALTQSQVDILFERSAEYLKPEDINLLRKAFDVAHEAHRGQLRKSGEPYITHPLAVAIQLTEWHLDAHGLAAALLHDVLEDTGVAKQTLADMFGNIVAELVDGLSKLGKLEYATRESAQAENFRKMVLAMASDIRVIIIKLSDRLHNMRTLGSMREEKRQRIARETMEIYAPIANRIGLNSVYHELQDLSFQYLYPNRYQVIAKAMRAARGNRNEVVDKILTNIRKLLAENKIKASVMGREKNLYSIYKKMQEKRLSFSEVLDIYGFRVVVDDASLCYLTLGMLHGLYKPIPGKFKDYIAIPKSNSYQSLHTTLFGPYGVPVEVQIRTQEMHSVAETGIASHWIYKSGDASLDAAQQRTHQWLQSLLDIQAESATAVEFLEHMKIDLFPDEVYVFTPKGKILVLPEGSTPVDFAYAVHTDIGHQCIASRVNYSLVPLRTELHNGDTVEIITSSQGKPNPAWLNFIASGRARSCIRSHLKSLQRDDAAQLGERLLSQALKAFSSEPLLLSDALKEGYLKSSPEQQAEFVDVLADIGMGRIMPFIAARRLVELSGSHLDRQVKVGSVLIRGNEGGMVQLSQCCHPIPGDDIIGIITKGQGLVVHRDNCPNGKRVDSEKQLKVDWEAQTDRMFSVMISVLAHKERSTLAEIATAISSTSANIETVETQDTHDGDDFIHINFNLKVSNLRHLEAVLSQIGLAKSVLKADRR